MSLSRTTTLALPLTMLLAALATALPPAPASAPAGTPLEAGGAFTCDFAIPGDYPMDRVGPVIERDRMYMAARPGMLFKHVPLAPDPARGELVTGGRYLFATEEDARAYKEWVEDEFVLDGVLFFDRPEFSDRECFAWRVIGAHAFAPLAAQGLVRAERWRAPDADAGALRDAWPGLVRDAEARGLSAVWLLQDEATGTVSLVTLADRVAPAPANPDVAGLALLAAAPSLGARFDDETGWSRSFDRAHWVLTTWFPFVLGDRGEAALWPHSPPLPEPYVGDGVCEVSRGERHANAPDDCGPTCGDGRADEGETSRDCPGDVRLFG